MVDIKEAKKDKEKKDVLKAVRISSRHSKLLEKNGVTFTQFVNQALKETFD